MDVERISIIKNFVPKTDKRLLDKASEYMPILKRTIHVPLEAYICHEEKQEPVQRVSKEEFSAAPLGAGDSIIFDFGTHMVGYCTMQVGYTGSHPDAPAYLRIQFAEVPSELEENADEYHGWISRSWIQEELIHLDRVPCTLNLSRRYAFRFVQITVIDTSKKYQLTFPKVICHAVSAVDFQNLPSINHKDEMLHQIDQVSIKTLAECMQEVFEDGPKRDRRLWLGDFRLQALVNYYSFRQMDLVRRCLYLFAGTRFPDDRVAACVFTDEEMTADDTWFSDYSLFFPVALEEFLRRCEDQEILQDLYELAVYQIDYALDVCRDGIVGEAFEEASFIDWCPNLDKHACIMGVLLYTLPYGICLAERMQDDKRITMYQKLLKEYRISAFEQFWDKDENCFLSCGQKSLTTQVWMVLGGVLSQKESAALLERYGDKDETYPMVSPYMHHYYLEALLFAGLEERAKEHLKRYWGSMISRGADTFWEIWNPDDPDASPYGGTIVNSWCHAWSCSPSLFLRNGSILQ